MRDGVDLRGANFQLPHGRSGFAGFEAAEYVIQYRNLEARANSSGEKTRAHARQFVEAIVIGLATLQLRVDRREQIVRFPLLERDSRIILAREGAKFVSNGGAFEILVEAALDREVKPFLGSRLHFKTHPGAVAENAQEADGLIRESVDRESADFLSFQVSQAVHGIEQQSAGLRGEGDRDGIDREIAAPEIFHDAGKMNYRLRTGAVVHVVACSRDRTFRLAGEDHLVMP